MSTQPANYLAHWIAALRGTAIGTAIYNLLNELEDVGVSASARLAFPNQPTTADTIDIGADTYEFVTAAGAVADDANIAVEIGASAAETLTNLVAAINADDSDDTHANITNVATDAPAKANGTESLFADELGTDLRIRAADDVGGTVIGGSPDVLLAESIADAADVWKEGNVNLNTLGGRAAGSRQRTLAEVTITAAMITNDLRLDVGFTPSRFTVQVLTAGVVIGTTSTDAFSIDNDGILVAFGGGAAPDMQVGDVLRVEIVG